MSMRMDAGMDMSAEMRAWVSPSLIEALVPPTGCFRQSRRRPGPSLASAASHPRGRSGEPVGSILDIARWQFGIITVYHFLFVPITIGLSAIVAAYETAWVRTGNPSTGSG